MGGADMKRESIFLCRPCAVRMMEAFSVVPLPGGTEKDTCAECRKRRYGKKYVVEVNK